MSFKHPAAVSVTVVIALLEWLHVTHVVELVWKGSPEWVKSLLEASVTSFHLDLLSVVVGFALGIGFMRFGPGFPPTSRGTKAPRKKPQRSTSKLARKTGGKPARKPSSKPRKPKATEARPAPDDGDARGGRRNR